MFSSSPISTKLGTVLSLNERQLFPSGRGDNYHKKCILGLLLNFFCYNDKFALLPACLLGQVGIASQECFGQWASCLII